MSKKQQIKLNAFEDLHEISNMIREKTGLSAITPPKTYLKLHEELRKSLVLFNKEAGKCLNVHLNADKKGVERIVFNHKQAYYPKIVAEQDQHLMKIKIRKNYFVSTEQFLIIISNLLNSKKP